MQYTICNEIENALFFTLDTVRSCGIGYNVTEPDKEKVFGPFNDRTIEYDKTLCLHKLFEEQVKKYTDKNVLLMIN